MLRCGNSIVRYLAASQRVPNSSDAIKRRQERLLGDTATPKSYSLARATPFTAIRCG
jgi:hypothetical protein